MGRDGHDHASRPLLSAIDHSTIVSSNDTLRRLLGSLEKHHLIHIVLHWIHEAQHSPSPNLLAPQLSRRLSQRHKTTDDVLPLQENQNESLSSYLDLHEERRARSYKELTLLWLENMSDARIPKARGIDRILNVDWPSGLTYAMIATLAFELVRSGPVKRLWQTLRLDYDSVEKANNSLGLSSLPSHSTLHHLTASQLCDRFSSELQHYTSHAVFLDSAIQESPDSLSTAILDPLPKNWCQFFTHLRVVTNATPIDVCSSTGLHILHIPHSSWFLVSGTLGRTGGEVKEMALTALANSLGAKRIKTAQEVLKGEESVVEMGLMTEMNGKDPLALRDVLLNAGLVGEGPDEDAKYGEVGKGVLGGKGRSMKRGEAEDGPLTRAEKRQRDDPTGLYADLEEQQHAWQEQDFDPDNLQHPLWQQHLHRKRQKLEHSRNREVDELFGKRQDLPRLERLRFQLKLPVPTMPGYGTVNDETIKAHPIELRLQGSHILAGLRTLVQSGLTSDTFLPQESASLPTWLTNIRGTKVTIGLENRTILKSPSDVS